MIIFPMLQRRPLKDGFHAIQGVTSLLNDGSPEGKSEFSNDLAQAIRPLYDPDVKRAAAWVKERQRSKSGAKRDRSQVSDDLEAIVVAKKSYRNNHGIIRTAGPPPDEMKKLVSGVKRKWADAKALAQSADPPRRCVIKSETSENKGTIEYLDELLKDGGCIDKGCYSHPLAIEDMCWARRRHRAATTAISHSSPSAIASGTST